MRVGRQGIFRIHGLESSVFIPDSALPAYCVGLGNNIENWCDGISFGNPRFYTADVVWNQVITLAVPAQ